MENEVLCLIRHSWQMHYVNQKKKKNFHMVHNIPQMKSKASQEGALGDSEVKLQGTNVLF